MDQQSSPPPPKKNIHSALLPLSICPSYFPRTCWWAPQITKVGPLGSKTTHNSRPNSLPALGTPRGTIICPFCTLHSTTVCMYARVVMCTVFVYKKLEANHITHSWSLSLAKCWISLQVTSTIPSKQNTCSTMYLHLSMSYHLGNLRGYPTSLFVQGLHLGPMVGIIHHHLETIKAHALELFSSRHVRRIGLVQRWGAALRWKIGDGGHIDVWQWCEANNADPHFECWE